MAANDDANSPQYPPPEKLVNRPINVQRNAQTTVRMPNDPQVADHTRWFETGGTPAMQPVRAGNDVTFLIDGLETFREMVAAIRTANQEGHFIYLLAWWLSDNFALVPGDATSSIQSLFASASRRNVQVRAMCWDQLGIQNAAEVNRINALANGAAIHDNRTLNLGSHHQKILIVKGSEGLRTFCGGVDINDDRISVVARQPGSPMHDVHCKILGPAAFDLLQIFVQRWQDHPAHVALDRAKGALLGLREPVPAAIAGRNHFVQIGRTFGNGNRHRGIDSDQFGTRPRGYAFAPNGEQTARRMIFKAIGEARRFIYIEDQYLVSMEASRALQAALPNIEHLTILIPHGSISDLPQVNFRRREFIVPLRRAGGTKVRVFFLNPVGARHTYVHAKMYIMDDQFAIIGSANCNRRGFTHDSEVVAGIFDPSQNDTLAQHFAHQLRIQLWAEHLNLDTPTGHAQLNDGVASAVHWLHPPAGAHIAPYDENRDIERVHTAPAWDTAEDPDGS